MLFLYKIFLIYFTININYVVSLDDNFTSRVIGGFNCNITKYPFIVSVVSPSLCGGTLITLEWVLTAAHCIEDGTYNIIVRAGFNSDKKYIQFKHAKDAIIHKDYDSELMDAGKELRYDIGLILLDQPFVRSPVAQPGRLAHRGYARRCNSIRVAGIGRTYPSEHPSYVNSVATRPLKCVDLKIVNARECSKYYRRATIDDTLICTQDREGKDTCIGDSGGPIFCDDVVIGIVSFGPSQCGGGDGATNTNIEKYLDFIWGNVNKGRLKEEKMMTESIDNQQEYTTHSRSTKEGASGSCKLHKSLWKAIWNILFTICFMYFFV